MPAKLDAMEQTLIQQKMEFRDLKHMCEDALIARDQAKVHYDSTVPKLHPVVMNHVTEI